MVSPNPRRNQNGSRGNRQNLTQPLVQRQQAFSIQRPIRSQLQLSTSQNGFNQSRPDPSQLPPLPPTEEQRLRLGNSWPPPYRVDPLQRLHQINRFMRLLTERWEAAHYSGQDGYGPGYTSINQLQADFDVTQRVARLVDSRLREMGERLGQARGFRPGHATSYFTGGPINQINTTMLPVQMSGFGNTNMNNSGNGVSGANSNNGQPPIGLFPSSNVNGRNGQPPIGSFPSSHGNNGQTSLDIFSVDHDNPSSPSFHSEQISEGGTPVNDEKYSDDDSER